MPNMMMPNVLPDFVRRDLRKVLCCMGAGLVLAGLSACHGKMTKSEDQRNASGQVLQGSISDAMLPYESTKSQPPLAPRIASGGGASAGEAASSAASDAASAASDAGGAASFAASGGGQ